MVVMKNKASSIPVPFLEFCLDLHLDMELIRLGCVWDWRGGSK